MQQYLESSEWVDCDHPLVSEKAASKKSSKSYDGEERGPACMV
jgi:hypothetical protein